MSRDRDQLRPQSLPDLPAWLEALLPEPREPMVMSVVDEGTLRLRFPDGRIESFDTLPEAHRAALDSDLDLFVEDNVFEEAILLLAERVEMCFDHEGNPKSEDQINLPVPDWVQQLKSPVADVD